MPENPEINVISNILDYDGFRVGGLGDGEAQWHANMTYVETPVHACALYAIEVPKTAGNTGFASMIAAYDAWSVQIKERLQGLSCKHDASRNSTGQLRKGFEEYYGNVTQVPSFVHPLVRVNPETGVKALYLGCRDNAYVMGLGIDESEALLEEVWAHVAKPEFAWAQEWRVGDLVFWDNRYCLHRGDAFPSDTRRHMRGMQIGVDRPVAA